MARRLANKSRRGVPKVTELGKRIYDSKQEKLSEYQRKIQDGNYVDFAIEKIASELTHFLLK